MMRFPWMHSNPKYAAFSVGRWTYGEPRILEYSRSNPNPCFAVGSFSAFSAGVVILYGGHRLDWVTSAPLYAAGLAPPGETKPPGWNVTKGPVRVGCDVWVGMDALIMQGVTIGDGAVVGARSVVTHDVEPYEIVAGNPARYIGFRFDYETRRRLLAIAWWDWPDEKIRESWALLHGDAEAFVKRHYVEDAA